MPTQINTVLGTISSADLGPMFTHEHVTAAPSGSELDGTNPFDYEGSLLDVVAQMKELKAAGISSIIDPIPLDLGRKVDFMADVSEASEVTIVCATGIYIDHGPMAAYPPYFRMRSQEELTEIFVKEITEGVGPRKIKPGVIKCATGPDEMSQNEDKALRAASQAHLQTGVPIVTHTTDGMLGPEQCDLFESEGVPLNRVIIGHCSDSADLAYHRQIVDRGAFIGFDRVGLERWMNDEMKVGAIAALVAQGFTDRIVLSHDNVGCMHGWRYREGMDDDLKNKRSFTYILREFIPALKAAGINEDAIQTILVHNPRRFFEG